MINGVGKRQKRELKGMANQPGTCMINNVESTPTALQIRKPRRHREHRGTQSIVNQHYKLSETLWLCGFVV